MLPGQLCCQMLAALALLEPCSTDSASVKKAWVQRLVSEVLYGRAIMKDAPGIVHFTHGNQVRVWVNNYLMCQFVVCSSCM